MTPRLHPGRPRIVVVVVATAMLAAACGATLDAASTSTSTTPPPTSETTSTMTEETTAPETTPPEVAPSEPGDGTSTLVPVTSPSIDVPAGLEARVAAAVDDLAARLGVAPGDLAVVAAEFVVWPDGSLGCPEPGREYLQVLTDGYRIGLAYVGVTYWYHGGGRVAPFLCDSPNRTDPSGGSSS